MFKKNGDRFETPPLPFVRFRLLFKRTQPPPSLQDEQWTLKKSKPHIEVKTKNKQEVEEVHDNASAFLDLNIKTHE